MNAEIIVIGNQEDVADSALKNAQYLQQQLNLAGINMTNQSAALVSPQRLERLLASALDRSEIVIMTGGLGIGEEAIAKQTLCDTLGLSSELCEEELSRVKAYLDQNGIQMDDVYVKQAMFPRHSILFKNYLGLSSGFAIKGTNKILLSLPQDHMELKAMFERDVLPFLQQSSSSAMVNHVVHVIGPSYEEIMDQVGSMTELLNPTVRIIPEKGEVSIHIAAKANTKHHAENACISVLKQLHFILGDDIYGQDTQGIVSVACHKMASGAATVSVCELGSGGAIAQKITNDPQGQQVMIDSEMQDPLSYPSASFLKKYTAVSEETAVYLAKESCYMSKSTFGISFVSPTPKALESAPNTPTDAVYAAVYTDGKAWTKRFAASVDSIELAAVWSLDMIRRCLDLSNSVLDTAYKVSSSGKIKAKGVSGTAQAENTLQTAQENHVQSPQVSRFPDGRIPWYKRVVTYCFPQSEDRVGEKIRKVLFTLSVLTCIVCITMISVRLGGTVVNQKQSASLKNLLTQTTSAPSGYPEGYSQKFAGLYKENKDVAGWLSIGGTKIDYPVVQSENNTDYLSKSFKGKKDKRGSLLMDFRNDPRVAGSNTIIYGTNLQDDTMFSTLSNYKDISYYREHPIISFDSVYGDGQYKIIGAFVTTEEGTDSTSFAYSEFLYPRSDKEYDWFVDEVTKRSFITTSVDVKTGDTLLTLAAPTNEIQKAYFVVVARKVRDGESTDVDLSSAKLNTKALLPDEWYVSFGGSKPNGIEAKKSPYEGYANVKENMGKEK